MNVDTIIRAAADYLNLRAEITDLRCDAATLVDAEWRESVGGLTDCVRVSSTCFYADPRQDCFGVIMTMLGIRFVLDASTQDEIDDLVFAQSEVWARDVEETRIPAGTAREIVAEALAAAPRRLFRTEAGPAFAASLAD